MIKIVVATTENNVIGVNGDLPWKKQKDDMKRFRELTTGHPVIMGRKTYDSMPFDLKDRHQIVMSRFNCIGKNRKFCGFGNTTVARFSYMALLEAKKRDDDIFIIGGSRVYDQFLHVTDEIHRTIVHTRTDGDTFFYIPEDFDLVEEKRYSADINNEYDYSFQIYRRPARG